MSRPQLRLVRLDDDRLPLPRQRRRDSVAVGFAIVGSLLCGVVLMCLALGWIRL